MRRRGMQRLDDCEYWIERHFNGRMVFWCWWVGVGSLGQRVPHRTLIGRERRA